MLLFELQKIIEFETRSLKPSSFKSVLSLSCYFLRLYFRLYNVFVNKMIYFLKRLQPSFLKSFAILGFSLEILIVKALKPSKIYIQISFLRSVLRNVFTKSICSIFQSFIVVIANNIRQEEGIMVDQPHFKLDNHVVLVFLFFKNQPVRQRLSTFKENFIRQKFKSF